MDIDEPKTSPAERVLAYHARTKHHLHRAARSAGFMDWANQPDPFRTFEGAPSAPLPLLADRLDTPYGRLGVPGAVASRPLDRDGIALLFELALGLSAWKEYQGERWALRCNPSSGNLHPTEGYVLAPRLEELEAGVYHYASRDHRLERRCALPDGDGVGKALPSRAVLVGLSTIAWREAWKYGERAYRYCQLDAGHALGAVRYAAAALGWSASLLEHVADADLAAWLGLDRDEDFAGLDPADRERPLLALLVGPPPLDVEGFDPLAVGRAIGIGAWSGRANRLSPAHVAWPVIGAVARAAAKPALAREAATLPALPSLAQGGPIPAATLIRRRRSCLGLDGRGSIAAETFFDLLDRLLPRPGVPPWDALGWRPLVHAVLFVHRVRGLAPGLYLFQRNEETRLSDALRPGFEGASVAGCPSHLRLSLLARRDLRDVARVASCHQDIASDGAFCASLIAELGDTVRARGPWWYRHLHWEAGMLGHVLYLEAEAAGVRGTGIGCYFDDVVHDMLGLDGDRFQALCHFTVGAPVEDRRLTTLPPYAHL